MLAQREITPGLVLHLDPDELQKSGGTFTCEESRRVRAGHFFVCLDVEDTTARWLPLYTRPDVGRQKLADTGRTGHSKWTGASCYWHYEQIWQAPHTAVIAAAAKGGDMSRLGARNRLEVPALPSL